MSPLALILLGSAAIYILSRRSKTGAAGVGKLSDDPLELENILMGVSRGWYTARPQIMKGFGAVVWLTGKKADGEIVEDVFPISMDTYYSLQDNGIGKLPKRRIYHELQAVQDAGINLADPYSSTNATHLDSIARRFGYKGSQRSSKPLAEQYFSNLQRAYKAISGTDLPYKESTVYNEQGDEILRYRDYGTDEQKISRAIDELTAGTNDAAVYWRVVGDIANGQCKLLWNVSDKDRQAGKKGLEDWITGRRSGSPDRKYYRGVLASAKAGGITPEAYAHRLWEAFGMQMDDSRIRDIVVDAINDVSNPQQARDMLLQQYYSMHQTPDDYYRDMDQYEQQRMFDASDLQQANKLQFEDMPF